MSRTYHYDGLGSTIALSDETGNVTDTYTYDAWGNVTPGEDNVTTDNPYQYVGKLGYYTHYQEPDFAMLSLGVRFYDPSLGRFTQLDPIKDGVNWYGYVGGNPLGAVDPNGLYVQIGIGCSKGESAQVKSAIGGVWRALWYHRQKQSGCIWDCLNDFLQAPAAMSKSTVEISSLTPKYTVGHNRL